MNLEQVQKSIYYINNAGVTLGDELARVMLKTLSDAKISGYVRRVSLDPLKYEWTERGQAAFDLQVKQDRFVKFEGYLLKRYGSSSTKYYRYRKLALQKYIIGV